MKRVAVIGDIHACLDELQDLYRALLHHSLDEIRHVGDLVDRGPDSGGVVSFCRERGIEGVMGNHESVLLERYIKGAGKKLNADKERSILSIANGDDWEYLRALPYLHVDDASRVVYVHAGLYPGIDLYRQPPKACCTVQLVNPREPIGKTRWFDIDNRGNTEAQNRAEGWVRWYEVCDHPYLVVYGHSVYEHPMVYGNTIGIDTGCVFGGALTAVILPDKRFVSVKARKTYWEKTK